MGLRKAVIVLLFVSFAYAHEGDEIRFINGYIIEFHSENGFEFDILNETGYPVDSVPLVQIYRGDVLLQETVASEMSDEGYDFIPDNLPPGIYEIRPVFTVGSRIVSARFDYEKKGNIIDQIVLFLASLFSKEKTADAHVHADLAVYLDGKKLNLSQEKYMENSTSPFSELIHLHDMNGNTVHKHALGVNLGHFFGTIGMKFNSTCFVLDNGSAYCEMRMFVNGAENNTYNDYEFLDLDRILITAGNYSENDLPAMVSSVTNNSCIQSGSCPERGTPFDESSCTTGNGCE